MRRVSHVVAGVLGGVVLAGCGGAPSASPPPSPTSSESSSASAPSPPTTPAAVSEKTEAGAEATVKWFLASMDYAGNTGDVDAFRRTFDETCVKCSAIADGIERTYAAGGSIKGGEWVPFGFKYYGVTDDVGSIDAAVNYEAQQFISKSGASPKTYKAKKNVLKAFQLSWDGAWSVGALDPEL